MAKQPTLGQRPRRPANRPPVPRSELQRSNRRTVRFVPVRARRAFEEVCDQIREEIAVGALQSGDRLPAERKLAEQFAVSRTAIREALKALEVAGLVQIETGVKGGAYIKDVDPQVVALAIRDSVRLNQSSINEITEARTLLTIDAIRLACERATDSDLDEIEKDIELCEQLSIERNLHRSAYIVEFYNLLAKAAHNDVLAMLINSLSELQRQMLARISLSPRPDVLKVRRQVLAHLRERDAEKAIAEITRFLKSLSRYLRSATERNAD